MTAKKLFVVGSVIYNVGGALAIATLGAVAKVPPAEYWPVVLGCVGVGGVWFALLGYLHIDSKD